MFGKIHDRGTSGDHAMGCFLTVSHPSHFCTSFLQHPRPTSLISDLAVQWNLNPTSGKDKVILSKPRSSCVGTFLIVLRPQNHVCHLCFLGRQPMAGKNKGHKMLTLCCGYLTMTWLIKHSTLCPCFGLHVRK